MILCHQCFTKAVSNARFCHNSEGNNLNTLPDDPFWWKHQYMMMMMMIIIIIVTTTTTFIEMP
jgi:hypothetical protein